MNIIDLKDRVAVVTGGAQGIGYAIASRLQQSGASIALWDHDEALLGEAVSTLSNSGNVISSVTDVSNADSVVAATQNTVAEFKRIDILVNSAGIAGPNGPTWDYPVDDWRRVLDVNLTGTFLTCRSVLPVMRSNGYGRVLNIASIAGKEGNPNASAYSASKAGVIALTKSLAKETVDLDIAVNCVTPAAARTRIFDQMTEEHINFMLAKIPRERFVDVNEIAAMVAWVVSAENSYTTGAAFDLSGGRATY